MPAVVAVPVNPPDMFSAANWPAGFDVNARFAKVHCVATCVVALWIVFVHAFLPVSVSSEVSWILG